MLCPLGDKRAFIFYRGIKRSGQVTVGMCVLDTGAELVGGCMRQGKIEESPTKIKIINVIVATKSIVDLLLPLLDKDRLSVLDNTNIGLMLLIGLSDNKEYILYAHFFNTSSAYSFLLNIRGDVDVTITCTPNVAYVTLSPLKIVCSLIFILDNEAELTTLLV